MTRIILLAALALAAALSVSARCYQPDTRVVVFVQGLYTTLDAEGTQGTGVEPHRFDTLKDAFRAAGYKDAVLLDFSYDGGAVSRDGDWRPAPYACADTDRHIDQSVARLEALITAYGNAHPKAHFTLVGHSLGGVIAFEAAVRDAPRDKDSRLEIDGVITFDAPLLGVSADKKPIIDIISCAKTYIAGAELVALRADAGAVARRTAEAAALRDAGIRLATLGSTTDCLLDTSHCTGGGFIDDGFSQYIEGADLSRAYDVPAAPLVSHDAILAFPPAVADAVAFAGKP